MLVFPFVLIPKSSLGVKNFLKDFFFVRKAAAVRSVSHRGFDVTEGSKYLCWLWVGRISLRRAEALQGDPLWTQTVESVKWTDGFGFKPNTSLPCSYSANLLFHRAALCSYCSRNLNVWLNQHLEPHVWQSEQLWYWCRNKIQKGFHTVKKHWVRQNKGYNSTWNK